MRDDLPTTMSEIEIKLVAIDLDGTLYTNDKQIKDVTVRAISQARERDVEVLLVSARPPFGMRAAYEKLGLSGFGVAYNGAYVFDHTTGEVFLRHPMRSEDAVKIVQLSRRYSIYIGYYVGDAFYVEKVCDEMRLEERSQGQSPVIVSDIINDAPKQPDKIIAIELNDTESLKAYYQEARKVAPELNIHYSSPNSFEVGNTCASKGLALDWVAKRKGINQVHRMAIGDNFNDLTMFDVAGITVAVGNAPEEVKRRAMMVVASNDEDGVAEAIDRCILNP
jgi:Cof subfamily protein (haloacid dehalogenase superfamily)